MGLMASGPADPNYKAGLLGVGPDLIKTEQWHPAFEKTYWTGGFPLAERRGILSDVEGRAAA